MLKATLEFYRKFLPDVGFKIEDDDTIKKYSRNAKGVAYLPIKGEGHPLVLGTDEMLNGKDSENIIYHPLTEDALKGESFTIKVTKDQMNAMIRMRLLTTVLGFGTALVEKRNSKVSPKQTKLFNLNPDFNDKDLDALAKILKRGKASAINRHVVGIYLHSKNCSYEGHEVKRLAKVTSALYDVLDKGEKEVWGVKVTHKSQKAIKQLFDSILPGLNDGEYNHGSNSKTAPYFDSLTNAYLNVSYGLDSIDSTCKSLYNDELSIVPTYEWVGGLTQLAKLAMAIPPLRGNLGNEIIGQAAFSVPVGRENSVIKEQAPVVNNTPNASPVEKTSPMSVTSPVESQHPMFRNTAPTSSIPQPASMPMPSTIPQQNSGSHPFMQQQANQPSAMPGSDDSGLF